MAKKKPKLDVLQMPLFTAESDWRPPELGDLPSWKGARRVGVDIETFDPHLKQTGPSVRTGGFVCGVSFCLEGDRPYYLPLRHFGGDNVPHDQAVYYLKSQAAEFEGEIVGANFQYDLDYLAEMGIVFPRVKAIRDIQIAEPLLYELHNSYSLEAIAQRYGYEGKSEKMLKQAAQDFQIDPKSGMWRLPARYVGEYAEDDARLVVEIIGRQEVELERQGLMEVYELESKLQPVLLNMRRHGVRIDTDKLDEIERVARESEQADCEELSRRTGISCGIGDINKKAITSAMLTEIGVRFRRTATGQPQIDNVLLDQIDHPVADMIQHAKKVNKIRTTFVQSVRNHMVKGRIHATFNQLRRTRESGDESGAKYGRLSCADPNLQQQPARDPEFAKLWRSIYVPDRDDQLWCAADYSQQEPRMLAHFAEIVGLNGAHAAAEAYRNDPDNDNHSMMTRMIWPELAGLDDKDDEFVLARKSAKTIFLGLCYGMGSGKLAQGLGLPVEVKRRRDGTTFLVAGPEGQRLLERFHRSVPYVGKMADKCAARAARRGYILTLSGRRCRFPQNKNGIGYDWTYRALNRLIQGSSADQTKMAMVALHEAGLPIQLQVHDEICSSVDNIEQAREIAHIMENVIELRVPSKVDIEIGPSWGEAVEIGG
ncbi:MAG: hypothetical protein GY906_03760 [bacterium]|nr:hypothetical protein [bacterium]